MAGLGAVAGLKEELTCPICLGIFRSPVSLSCGHSFCKGCIQEARRGRQGPFSCPLCQACVDPPADPQPNVQLCSIVERLLNAAPRTGEEGCDAPREEEGDSSGQPEVTLCDFCLWEPQPGVKTCLTCEASLCQAHLSKHNTKSPTKDHILVEPCDAQSLAERRCPQHGKPLECYCQTDSVCICVLCCVIGSHKSHKIITLEKAFGQAQNIFPKTLETMKTHEAALDRSIASLLEQQEQVKAKGSLQRDQLKSLFDEMCMQLETKEEQVLKTLSHNEEQHLAEIQTEIEKQKKEKDAVSRDVQEMEALRDQKDLLLYTKTFAAIRARKHKPVPNTVGVQLPQPPIILNELTTNTTLRFFQQFLSDMQSLFKALPVHQHLTCSAAHPDQTIFDSSFGCYTYSIPHNPYSLPYVQSHQSFSEGCHFWEVDTSNARCWKLGIIHNKIECYLCMCCDYLSVFLGETMITTENFSAGFKVIRVELDCRRNTLSFYNMSVKGGGPAERLKLIQAVSIPSNYPAYATFFVSNGSLRLL
ncbi:E3 ubiquitin/ISG15 ligase TRIM25-like [Falco peregrinus]|uniref:E3 ubiquitin/ISG15 ligase TRIM25-like n=1 Tax=Falco peregrinus TaxID=8954 RepID=UPI002479158C|nr:E3 ubiquitin/ISG15 ligase TRIM25-like [Falco peregrinus]